MDIFNKLIDESIDSLVNDTASQAADSLQELAKMFANAGLPQSSFEDVRQYIVNEAKAKGDTLFIQEKLLTAERNLKVQRYVSR